MKTRLWGIVVAVIALLAAGCESRVEFTERLTDNKAIDTVQVHCLNSYSNAYVFNVKGHEYIWLDGYNKGGLIHSESCNSPTHIKQ